MSEGPKDPYAFLNHPVSLEIQRLVSDIFNRGPLTEEGLSKIHDEFDAAVQEVESKHENVHKIWVLHEPNHYRQSKLDLSWYLSSKTTIIIDFKDEPAIVLWAGPWLKDATTYRPSIPESVFLQAEQPKQNA